MARLSILFLCVVFAVFVIGSTAEDGFCDFQGRKIPYGEFYNSDHPCMRSQCHDDGSISGVGCPTFQAPGCEIKKGTGPYPACCEHPVCPK